MKKDVKTLIKEYLQEAKLIQLATSINNQPWVCSVWFASDEDLNIYWFSSISRRHSEELDVNNRVAGAIALPHDPKDPVRGVQFQGVAEVLSDEEDINKALSVYQGRIFNRERIDDLAKNRAHKFYKIKPTKFVLFDSVNFPDNPRQELDLL